jgi:hypothetical protein
MGDFVGEDIIYEKVSLLRQECAYSEGESYLLEIQLEDWKRMKELMSMMNLKKDFLFIEAHMRKCWQQNKNWR